jgi:hypothetical protein
VVNNKGRVRQITEAQGPAMQGVTEPTYPALPPGLAHLVHHGHALAGASRAGAGRAGAGRAGRVLRANGMLTSENMEPGCSVAVAVQGVRN